MKSVIYFCKIAGFLIVLASGSFGFAAELGSENSGIERFDGHYVKTEVRGDEIMYDFLRGMSPESIPLDSTKSSSLRECPANLYVISVPNSKRYDILLKPEAMSADQIASYAQNPNSDFYADGLLDKTGKHTTCDRNGDKGINCLFTYLIDDYKGEEYKSSVKSIKYKSYDSMKNLKKISISKDGDSLVVEKELARSMFMDNTHTVTWKYQFKCQYKLAE